MADGEWCSLMVPINGYKTQLVTVQDAANHGVLFGPQAVGLNHPQKRWLDQCQTGPPL